MATDDLVRPGQERPRKLLGQLLLPDRDSRAVALWAFITMLGNGMFTAGAVVYFVRGVGLSSHEVGLGLTVSGLLGLGVGIPVGRLADRFGPRTVCIVTLLLKAGGILMFLAVRSFPAFLAAAFLVACADVGGNAAGGALIGGVGGSDRVRLRSYIHAVTNAAAAGGALLAGVVLAADTRTAYRAMIVGTAVTLAAAALVLLRVGSVPRVPAPAGTGRWDWLRDRRYLTMTALQSLMTMYNEILTFAVPLWLLRSGAAPTWLVSVLLVINTVTIVLFQLPASRGVTSARTAAAVGRRAWMVLLAACAVIGIAGYLGTWLAVACFAVGTALLTVGELFQSASSFSLSYDLAPEHAQGQYQGVFALGRGTAKAAAPALLAIPCTQWGFTGWVVVGAVLAIAGLLLPAATRVSGREQPVPA